MERPTFVDTTMAMLADQLSPDTRDRLRTFEEQRAASLAADEARRANPTTFADARAELLRAIVEAAKSLDGLRASALAEALLRLITAEGACN